MRRSSSPLNTSELFLMLPSAKHVGRAKASPSVALQRGALPSIRHGSAPSSPAAAHAPLSPDMRDPAELPPGPRKQQSPSPTRQSGYIRPVKKKAEFVLEAADTADTHSPTNFAQHEHAQLRVRSFIVHALQQLAMSDSQHLTPDALATAAMLLKQCATFATPLQPVLQEVSHRVLCGLFKEYEDEWQQQQLLPAHRRKERDIRAMNPYFLERAQVAAVISRLERELQDKDAELRALQVQNETQKLQKLQLQERLRDKQAKLALQQQHDNGLHNLLGRSMGRLEATKDALMLADEQVQRYKMMEKSREHQEQNLQREYQGKNQELTQLLLACQMELAGKIDETQRLQVAMGAMYTQEHVDKLEREIQKANLLLIKVQSKWQQAQMSGSAGAAAAGETVDGGGSTPRPDWEEARERLPGLQVPRNLSTSQQVKFLVAMLEGMLPKDAVRIHAKGAAALPESENKGEFFDGLGNIPEAPKYLRIKGKVRNRNISKRDTEALIRDMWKCKHAHDKKNSAKGKPPEDIHEYIYMYLQQKHGNFQNVICEVAYNLMDGLKRYKADADIEMLGLILAGELREEVYTLQLQLLDLVFAACERAELDGLPAGAQPTGVLTWAKFEKTVRNVLPLKADDLFEQVMQSAREQQPNGWAVEMKGEVEYIKYGMLFEEDREFNQGPFAEALRDQYVDERNDWLEELRTTLHELLAAKDPANAKLDAASLDMIQETAEDFRRAILVFDGSKPPKEIDRYIARGFAMEGKSLDLSMQVSYDDFAMFLRQGIIKYHTKPENSSIKAFRKAERLASSTVAKSAVVSEN